jgi:hypothetical protein
MARIKVARAQACLGPATETVTFHVGTDYAMWALITVNPIFLPTSTGIRTPGQISRRRASQGR